MTFNFTVKEFILGNGNGTPTLQFYKRGFNLGGSGSQPSWRDVILSGNTALTLTNAKANSLNYLKLFGSTVQNGTPTPTTPIDIVCNNGAVKVSKNLFDYRYFYDNYQTYGQSAVGRCPIKLQPNTTYTVSTNEEVYSTSASMFVVSGNAIDWTPNTYSNGILVNSPRKVTTDSNGYLCFGLYVTSENAIPESDFVNGVVWVQIEQGSSATPYMPYGQIYTDGTQETVEITGKNIFGEYTTETGYWQSNGTWSTDANYNSYQYITLKPNTTYTISNDVAPDYWRLTLFNGNTFSSRLLQQGGTSYTFTTNTSENKISIAFDKTSMPDVSKVQLELGSTATTYENYFNGGTATAEMLLKVGTYQDVQEVLTGSVTRNIGIKVLDGTENWVYDDSFSRFYTTFIPLSIAQAQARSIPAYCTHFQMLSNGEPISDITSGQGYVVRSSSSITISYLYLHSTQTTSADFKQWLSDQYNSGNPVIIVYPLATPTVETVEPQHLGIQAGTNIVEITQASMDNLGLEVSYKATV